jgi:asparaginyl-tRNA synthetase
MKIKEISTKYQELINTKVTVNGWVLSVRTQKDITFVKLNDGSNSLGIQLIAETKINELEKVNTGSSLSVHGLLVKSPANGQPFEIKIISVKVLGYTNLDEYPLAKSRLSVEYLRNYAHLRPRISSFGSIFRIKSSISQATNKYFMEKGYLHINPNIITVNECEGGAGVFQLTEQDITDYSKLTHIKNTSKHEWSQDHFGKPAYLTVSSQLQLEALACSLGSVYTTNKSFRSEHSTTNKHLSEFEHLEIEDVFVNIDDLMQTGEDYIKYVGQYLLDNNSEDIDNLGKFVSKGLKERIETIINSTFHRIRYSEAIDILKKASELSKPVVYGEDICTEFENYLTKYFKGPVFISHWPIAIKSFYMKRSIDNDTCENFDLLMPYKIGELIGGSIREDNLDKMIEIMKQKGVSSEPLQFYLDLRKFGTVPHGGFGLGLDRMCMMYTGMENIKDVVAYPVFYKTCNY